MKYFHTQRIWLTKCNSILKNMLWNMVGFIHIFYLKIHSISKTIIDFTDQTHMVFKMELDCLIQDIFETTLCLKICRLIYIKSNEFLKINKAYRRTCVHASRTWDIKREMAMKVSNKYLEIFYYMKNSKNMCLDSRTYSYRGIWPPFDIRK